MKIDINKDEQTKLLEAIKVKQAALQRAANSESNPQIEQIRINEINEYAAIANKLITQELIK